MRKSYALTGWAGGLLLLGFVACAGCGEDTKPHPGYASPCDTPAAGVLGCPLGPGSPAGSFTLADACRKLVTCGVLAESYYGQVGDICQNNGTCDSRRDGKCLPRGNETRCHYHLLDYYWCVANLQDLGSDPCDGSDHPTPLRPEHAQEVADCIRVTTCAALGAPVNEKLQGTAQRPAIDKQLCADGKTTIWTATTCDLGLLTY